mmetsp:Transcript_10687/g.14638  ORF Transcript_10687/g.14638 Transcript_10687/m.14638 type:complete len:902 (-) Transcript_10687:53-2758(-)
MNPVPRERSTSFFASIFGSKKEKDKEKETKESKTKKNDKSKVTVSPTSSQPTSPKKSPSKTKDDHKKPPKSPQKIQAFMRDSSSNDESPSSANSSSSQFPHSKAQVKEINIRDIMDEKLIQTAQDCDLECIITLVEERSECAELVQKFLQGVSRNDEEFLITQNSWTTMAELSNRFDEDPIILNHVTMALAIIAQDFGQHNNIVQYIKFPKLIELSNTDNIDTQLNVITLVAYLALNDDHHYNVTKYLLETLIFLGFTSQNMKVKIAVANTISNLALSEQDAVYICKEGGMELLQAWLSIDKHITVDKNIILLLKATLSAITNLTLATDKLKYQVIQKIGWRKISNYLQIQPVDDEDNGSPGRDHPLYLVNQILCSVTLAIANLATLNDQSESISSLNIVHLLKKCLISKLNNPLYNLDVIQGCILALNSISAYEDLQDQMIYDGLVEAHLDVKRKLLEVAKVQGSDLTERARGTMQSVMDLTLATLTNLNAESFFNNTDSKIDYQTISRNGNRGHLPAPEVTGQNGPVSELVQSIAKCIKANMESNGSSSSFKESFKMPLGRTNSNNSITSNDSYGSYSSINITVENVQFVLTQLKNIAKLPAANQITAASQTPNLLGNLVSIIPSPQLDRPCQEKIIDLILAICHDNRFEDTRLDNSSVQELLNLMNHGSIGPKAASLIAALSAYNKNLTRIMRSSGAIVRLVYLLNQTNMTTKSNALYALHALCNDAESQENVFQLGGLDSILKLVDLNLSDNMKCIVCLALKSIVTSNKKMQDHARKNYPAALETIIQFLMSSDSDVKSNTCRLILEIARNNEKNQSFLCKAGAPQLLVSTLVLTSFVNDELLFNAITAVWALSQKKKNRKEFVKSGVTDALEALNHVPSSKVQTATKQTLALFKKS